MTRVDASGRLVDFGRAFIASRTEVARADRSGGGDLARLQQRRLNDVVRHAVRRSRFYRDLYSDVDLDHLDVATLPPVTKAQLMARFDDWVTDDRAFPVGYVLTGSTSESYADGAESQVPSLRSPARRPGRPCHPSASAWTYR